MVLSRYRTFWRRCFASFIDTFVIGTTLILIDGWIQPATSQLIAILWLSIFLFLFPAYSILMHGFYGQTLGKMLTKVKVLDVSEGRLTFRSAIIRDIPTVLIAVSEFGALLADPSSYIEWHSSDYKENVISEGLLITWTILELVTMLFNEKRRAVHDLISDSVVVVDR